MPCGSHFIHHDDCPGCTGGRAQENKVTVDKAIGDKKVSPAVRKQVEAIVDGSRSARGRGK